MFGFFKKIFGSTDNSATNANPGGGYTPKPQVVSSPAASASDSKQINLSKRNEKITISLAKKGVENFVSEVKLVLDKSGSMDYLYECGDVQKVIDRLAPLAFRFDDDGKMQVTLFNTGISEKPEVTMDNYDSYSKKHLRNVCSGGTCYAPSIVELTKQASRGEFTYPVFVIFITDGENFDSSETERALIEASKYDIYFQFVGIGNESFRFLRRLDNLEGRDFDNAGFIQFSNMNNISDEMLYDELLKEFVDIYKKGQFKTGKISLKKTA